MMISIKQITNFAISSTGGAGAAPFWNGSGSATLTVNVSTSVMRPSLTKLNPFSFPSSAPKRPRRTLLFSPATVARGCLLPATALHSAARQLLARGGGLVSRLPEPR